MSEGTAQALE